MSDLLIGLLGALMATNQPAAVSNLVAETTGLTVNVADTKDPVEVEYRRIMLDDDMAQSEIDGWIRENNTFANQGASTPKETLNLRIRARLDTVRKEYQAFLKLHPDHARAHLAFGSFLNDIKEEAPAQEEWEKSRQLDPKNPAAWNNLANSYSHIGQLYPPEPAATNSVGRPSAIQKAFEYYTKASELNPAESIYYWNLAVVVYLFRKDAKEYYHTDEQQVFTRAMGLYAKAQSLDPNNFELATDLAQTYYGIKPVRTEEALNAWTNALKIAGSDVEREGVFIHLARFKMNAGQFAEARQHLNSVTNDFYAELKGRVLRNLNNQEAKAKETNQPPVKLEATKTGS